MNNLTNSKLHSCVNLFNNIFHNKNLIILLGKNGLIAVAIKKQKIIEDIFIRYDEEQYYQKHRDFIAKYTNYHLIVLLDTKESKLKHETLPLLAAIIETNPVEKFIAENYQADDIVAYNVYEIKSTNGEVWNTCIAHSPFVTQVKDLLEYIITKSFNYSGTYFLSLEFITIINKLLQTTETDCSNDLQIFTTITKASDIKIVIKHRNNIFLEQIVEYPQDKSDLYIKGTLEQAISDKLLSYKEYVKALNIKVAIIFLVDCELQKLVQEINFPTVTKIILPSIDKISKHNSQQQNRFQDLTLLEIFNNSNTFLALNKPLKTIAKLTLANNIIFKPALIVIAGMAIALGGLKVKSLIIYSKTTELNNSYYELAEQYRNIKKQHHELSNIDNLLDLYNLDRKAASPDEYIRKLTSADYQSIKIKKLSWELVDPILINIPESILELNIEVDYNGPIHSTIKGIEILNLYAKYLENNFKNYNVTYTKDPNEIVEVAKQVMIPAHFVIKGKVGASQNAK